MATHVQSRVARLVHTAVRRRAWTTASLSAAMLVVVVAMVGLIAWESTSREQAGEAVVDVELGDDSSSAMTIVGDSLFAPPLGARDDEADGGRSPGTEPAAAGRKAAAGGPRTGPREDAPPARRTGGDGGGGSRTPDPSRPAPTAPRPAAPTPVTDGTATVGPLDPVSVADPVPVADPQPVSPLPQVDETPIASVDASEPSVDAGPVAGVSADVGTDGVDASAPIVGDAPVSLG